MKNIFILFLSLFILGCSSTNINADKQYKEISKIDPILIEAIIQIESSGNPKAISSKGAIGLMQIMPSTGKSLGYTKEQLKNPEINVIAGIKYLNILMNEYCSSNVHCTLRAYYCGPARRNNSTCYRYADKVLSRAKEFGYTYKLRSSSKGSVKASRHKVTASTLKFNEPNYESTKPFNGYTFTVTEKKNNKR